MEFNLSKWNLPLQLSQKTKKILSHKSSLKLFNVMKHLDIHYTFLKYLVLFSANVGFFKILIIGLVKLVPNS